MEFLNFAEGGWHFYKQKKALCVKFLYAKTMNLPLRFYKRKAEHFASYFYIEKMPFVLRFYI